MKKITFLLIIIFLTIMCTPAYSTIKKVAQTGLQFLKVDVGARASAMGGAYMMVGEDASALFYNPAGIARMQSKMGIFSSRTQWIADISYIALGAAYNLGNLGKIGISTITSDYGDVFGTRLDDSEAGFVETGKLNVGAYAVGLTYAKALTDKFSVGGQVKYNSQQLGSSLLSNGETIDNDVSGLAYDFGTVFYPGFKSFRFGISIRNFSQQFKYEKQAFQLPLTFTIGAAMNLMDLVDSGSKNSLLLAIDALHPRDYTERLHLGLEYAFNNMFFFRGGYKVNYDEESFSVGIGFQQKLMLGSSIKIDYSFSDAGVFDSVNRISFGITF